MKAYDRNMECYNLFGKQDVNLKSLKKKIKAQTFICEILRDIGKNYA